MKYYTDRCERSSKLILLKAREIFRQSPDILTLTQSISQTIYVVHGDVLHMVKRLFLNSWSSILFEFAFLNVFRAAGQFWSQVNSKAKFIITL